MCLAVTCHLHFWLNDRDLLRATAVTRERNGYQHKSSQKTDPGEEKSPATSCGDSNPGPFDHESDALTTELSPLPSKTTKKPIFSPSHRVTYPRSRKSTGLTGRRGQASETIITPRTLSSSTFQPRGAVLETGNTETGGADLPQGSDPVDRYLYFLIQVKARLW